MSKEFYIQSYKYKDEIKYLLWYTNDKNGIITAENKILSFSSISQIEDYKKINSIDTETYEIKIDFDNIASWINGKSSTFDIKNILEIWNLFTDISESIDLDFKGDHKSHLTNKIYDKIFYGNNLPSVTPEGKSYSPIWNKFEIKRIKEIFLNGFEMFNKNIMYYK